MGGGEGRGGETITITITIRISHMKLDLHVGMFWFDFPSHYGWIELKSNLKGNKKTRFRLCLCPMRLAGLACCCTYCRLSCNILHHTKIQIFCWYLHAEVWKYFHVKNVLQNKNQAKSDNKVVCHVVITRVIMQSVSELLHRNLECVCVCLFVFLHRMWCWICLRSYHARRWEPVNLDVAVDIGSRASKR